MTDLREKTETKTILSHLPRHWCCPRYSLLVGGLKTNQKKRSTGHFHRRRSTHRRRTRWAFVSRGYGRIIYFYLHITCRRFGCSHAPKLEYGTFRKRRRTEVARPNHEHDCTLLFMDNVSRTHRRRRKSVNLFVVGAFSIICIVILLSCTLVIRKLALLAHILPFTHRPVYRSMPSLLCLTKERLLQFLYNSHSTNYSSYHQHNPEFLILCLNFDYTHKYVNCTRVVCVVPLPISLNFSIAIL